MHGTGTQRQYQAQAAAARVRAAFACAMPTSSWSTTSNVGVTTIDHKPGRPRRLRVNSP